MQRILILVLIAGLLPFVVQAADREPLEAEIIDTIMLDEAIPFSWSEDEEYWRLVPKEGVHYDRETGVLHWELSDTAYRGPICLGDVYTALIGNTPDNRGWASSISIDALQEYRVPLCSEYVVRGQINLARPLDSPVVVIIHGIGAGAMAAKLRGDHPDYVLYGHPIHVGLPEGMWSMAESLELTPLGDGWYRYHAVLGRSRFFHDDEQLLARCKTWAFIVFYDPDGWAVLQVRQSCDAGIILEDEPVTGVVYCERELAGFQVYTPYNVAGG